MVGQSGNDIFFVPSIFCQPVEEVARQLLGAELLIGGVGGLIVETEAYGLDDAASHSFIGKTARNEAMFGSPGRAYVYRSYGLHWCLNVVCREGEAVLLRALEPTTGINLMAERRGTTKPKLLCSGPGRLCMALDINGSFNGRPITEPPFSLTFNPAPSIVCGPRIGISKEVDRPWRFAVAGSAFVSGRLPQTAIAGFLPAGEDKQAGAETGKGLKRYPSKGLA